MKTWMINIAVIYRYEIKTFDIFFFLFPFLNFPSNRIDGFFESFGFVHRFGIELSVSSSNEWEG